MRRMALPPDEYKLFLSHLTERTNGNFPPCPVCGHNKWSVDGPVVMLEYSSELETAVVNGKGAPVVAMTCTYCLFVRQFAWLPILKKQVTFELPEEDSDAE
jgi:hypothetical protein